MSDVSAIGYLKMSCVPTFTLFTERVEVLESLFDRVKGTRDAPEPLIFIRLALSHLPLQRPEISLLSVNQPRRHRDPEFLQSQAGPVLHLNALAVNASGHLFAGGHGGVFRSTDNGDT